MIHIMEEIVDILAPPFFAKSGKTKTLEQAWHDQNWIGTFNLWIIQKRPKPAIVYQIRHPNASWAPNKLDVTAGGHYQAGEELFDGLREVEEELGKIYQPEQLTYVGRKIHVSPDQLGNERRNIVDIAFIVDNSPLDSYVLQKDEVFAVCSCPIDELIKTHTDPDHSFTTEILTADGKRKPLTVKRDSFPENWDDYHFKIALLAKRFIGGDKHLIY